LQNRRKTGIIKAVSDLIPLFLLFGGVKVSTGKLIYDKRAEVAEALKNAVL